MKYEKWITGLLREDPIMARFLERNIRNYEEPQRKGTSRGELIGFSKKKNAASYLRLTSLKLKEIAELTETNYDRMKKWNTQDEIFKEKIRENYKRFISFYTQESESWRNAIRESNQMSIFSWNDFKCWVDEVSKSRMRNDLKLDLFYTFFSRIKMSDENQPMASNLFSAEWIDNYGDKSQELQHLLYGALLRSMIERSEKIIQLPNMDKRDEFIETTLHVMKEFLTFLNMGERG